MVKPLLVPPRAPSPTGTSMQTTVAELATQFGDGQRESTPDGINYVREGGRWSWSGLEPSEAQALKAALLAAWFTGFRYALPYDAGGERKWKPEPGSPLIDAPDGPLHKRIEIQVREVFDYD